jgi:uncharacterized protein (DUF1684 family)
MTSAASAYLALTDWRRQVAALYAEWRLASQVDAAAATETFRAARDELFREHPQSPLMDEDRAVFRGLDYWPYDPGYRMEVRLDPDVGLRPPEEANDDAGADSLGTADPPGTAEPPGSAGTAKPPTRAADLPDLTLALPESHPTGARFRRIGTVELAGPLAGERLAVYWIDAYGGGLFLPFRDSTAGRETYGAGRYLLDTIKGADLGGDAERGTLLLDFNMAYPPSCAYDPRWACPLAPPDTFLTVPVPAGERRFEPGGSLPSQP